MSDSILLTRQQWQDCAAAHERRATALTQGHLDRRAHGETHPVWDFLFTYYPVRPAQLKRWQPGLGVALCDAADAPTAGTPHHTLDPDGTLTFDRASLLAKRGDSMAFIRSLLRRTADREPQFDCFGMHEWAMVYRDTPRHDLPLRLGADATNAVVESHRLKCTHYDAYRFFTPAARPLNLTVLDREHQIDNDRPGCVHVAMDVYKWAAKLGPLVPGELLLDTFELAARARRLDMEASPYDCTGLGFGVVAVETAAGKAEYVARQRELAEEAAPLRHALVALLDDLLSG